MIVFWCGLWLTLAGVIVMILGALLGGRRARPTDISVADPYADTVGIGCAMSAIGFIAAFVSAVTLIAAGAWHF